MFVVQLSYEQGNSHNNCVRNDVIGVLNYITHVQDGCLYVRVLITSLCL